MQLLVSPVASASRIGFTWIRLRAIDMSVSQLIFNSKKNETPGKSDWGVNTHSVQNRVRFCFFNFMSSYYFILEVLSQLFSLLLVLHLQFRVFFGLL